MSQITAHHGIPFCVLTRTGERCERDSDSDVAPDSDSDVVTGPELKFESESVVDSESDPDSDSDSSTRRFD